jgi:hypothetical protein
LAAPKEPNGDGDGGEVLRVPNGDEPEPDREAKPEVAKADEV